MVWAQLGISRPHVAYATTGFALLLFGTVSLFVKQRLYIGEATLSTVYGLIVGPHCLNWFSPTTWGNTDYITLELSRIVLVVQIFAVAVELPKKYMLKHWFSVVLLLVPVMTYGWVLTSVFIWKLVPTLRWVEALCIAACVTATDPVLASAVVGKGKFAKRVPGHLRNLLSAESGCNDGMAFPFAYLALNVMRFEHHAPEIAKDFICISVLYECVFGSVLGAVIGYCGRVLIKFAERYNLIDRESFLVYYFCLALFCAGVGTILGVDDLLVAFAAGAAFAWDGWFAKKTEKSEVSNVIDLLINGAYFIYFGAIIPWEKFNDNDLGIKAWKLVILAILVLLVRRIPIMLALKPIIPDIKTWREALFCGHFGPIGVGGLFIAILARAEMETDTTTPLRELPPPGTPHYYAITNIWPITCFLVLASIIVHGSSIAVFTLGKRLNNITITMSYTTAGSGPSWLSRLPERMKGEVSGGKDNVLRLEKIDTEAPHRPTFKRGAHSAKSKAGKKPKRDPSKVPVSLSIDLRGNKHIEKEAYIDKNKLQDKSNVKGFQEGSHVIFEDNDGNVIHDFDLGTNSNEVSGTPRLEVKNNDSTPSDDVQAHKPEDSSSTGTSDLTIARNSGDDDHRDPRSQASSSNNLAFTRTKSVLHLPRKGEQVHAYQQDDNIVVENSDGEVIRRYKILRRGATPYDVAHHHGLMDKTLDFLGWHRHHENEGAVPGKNTDVENAPKDTLFPVPAPHHDEAELSHHEENEIRNHLEQMLDRGELNEVEPDFHDARHEAIAGNSDQVNDEAEDEIPFQGSEDEDDDEETEVERNRRLAALGVIPADNEDDDQAHQGTPSVRRVNTIPEEEEEEPPRITFALPDKR